MSGKSRREIISGNAAVGRHPTVHAKLAGDDRANLGIARMLDTGFARRATPFDHVDRTSLMGGFVVGHRADDCQSVRNLRESRHVIRELNARNLRRNRRELAPDIGRRIWLGVESVVMRNSTLQPEQNDRLRFGRVIRFRQSLLPKNRREREPERAQRSCLQKTTSLTGRQRVVA